MTTYLLSPKKENAISKKDCITAHLLAEFTGSVLPEPSKMMQRCMPGTLKAICAEMAAGRQVTLL